VRVVRADVGAIVPLPEWLYFLGPPRPEPLNTVIGADFHGRQTVIGLVLYKSSGALFEQRTHKEGGVRRIWLVGSVCIAALAFFGLRQSTPAELLTGVPSSSKVVSITELRAAREALEQANAAIVRLKACVSVTPASNCTGEIDA
jgi:hypothetical protein